MIYIHTDRLLIIFKTELKCKANRKIQGHGQIGQNSLPICILFLICSVYLNLIICFSRIHLYLSISLYSCDVNNFFKYKEYYSYGTFQAPHFYP